MGARQSHYNFISKISTIFLKQQDFDKALNKSLKFLAKKTNADRSYIFIFKDDKYAQNTHEYCKKNVQSLIDSSQDIKIKDILWLVEQLQDKGEIYIPDANLLPKEAKALKKILKTQNVESVICIPFYMDKELAGFIGLDNTSKNTAWEKKTLQYLQLATNIISKAIEKKDVNLQISQMNSTLQATLESTDDAIVVIRKDGVILNHNKVFASMWNINNEVKSHHNDVTLPTAKLQMLEPSPEAFEKRIMRTLLSKKDDYFTAYLKNGKIIKIRSFALYVNEKHIGRVWRCADITKAKEYEQKIQLTSKVFEKSNDAILITDKDMKIIEVNESFEKITGFNSSEIYGQNPSLLQSNWHDKTFYKVLWDEIEKKGFWEGEIWDRRKNGEVYVSRTLISKIENDGKLTNYIAIAKDITRKKEYEEKIEQLAFYDVLTLLPNRAFFEQNLKNIIDESKRYNRKFGLLFLDLDNFKYVNDTFGHLCGDKLLQVVAKRLKECVRTSDVIARIGGDEFTIIVKDIKSNSDLIKISKKIIAHLLESIFIDEQELYIGSSIGVCTYPDDAKNYSELIQKADIAMYNSKNNGKNMYSFFCEDMNKNVLDRYQKEQYLKEAIVKNEFSLNYQPLVGVNKKYIDSVEALIRWQHPSLGSVAPDEFIPIAEENGFILKLGEWVFERICKDYEDLEKQNIKNISVNISVKQLMDIRFLDFIKNTLEKYEIDGKIFEFEITEKLFLNKTQIVIENISGLQKLGITFALDDFGKGYSSLNYIKEFEIDTIKIDRSFVNSMMKNEEDMAIVNTILFLSKELNKDVVAEGVETSEQLEFFKKQNNCNIQGYLLSKPVSIEALKDITKSYKS